MTSPVSLPPDQLAPLVDADTQRLAARMAQEVFAGLFRMAVDAEADDDTALDEVMARCFNWSRAAVDDEARVLRLALLVSGLDQWGLAYTQAFKLQAIPPLTALIGSLRTRLDAQDDARFQRCCRDLRQRVRRHRFQRLICGGRFIWLCGMRWRPVKLLNRLPPSCSRWAA